MNRTSLSHTRNTKTNVDKLSNHPKNKTGVRRPSRKHHAYSEETGRQRKD